MNNPFIPTTPATPSRTSVPAEPLSPSGDNFAFLNPELSTFMDDLRAKVTAARARFSKARLPSFTAFQQLPSEVRARIYELASYEPRVIEVTCHDKPISDTHAPALLHTSSESRTIALTVYKPLVLDGTETGTFVNWDLDTIFVNDRRASFNRLSTLNQFAVLHESCKKLASPSVAYGSFHLPVEYTKLESLVVVIQVASGDGNIEFVPEEGGEEASYLAKIECVRLWETKRVKSYMVRDANRGRVRSMNEKEKAASRKKRAEERKMIEPLRSDEDVALRLQYELDHGLI